MTDLRFFPIYKMVIAYVSNSVAFRTRDDMRQHASKHRKLFKTNNTLALQKKRA